MWLLPREVGTVAVPYEDKYVLFKLPETSVVQSPSQFLPLGPIKASPEKLNVQ